VNDVIVGRVNSPSKVDQSWGTVS